MCGPVRVRSPACAVPWHMLSPACAGSVRTTRDAALPRASDLGVGALAQPQQLHNMVHLRTCITRAYTRRDSTSDELAYAACTKLANAWYVTLDSFFLSGHSRGRRRSAYVPAARTCTPARIVSLSSTIDRYRAASAATVYRVGEGLAHGQVCEEDVVLQNKPKVPAWLRTLDHPCMYREL